MRPYSTDDETAPLLGDDRSPTNLAENGIVAEDAPADQAEAGISAAMRVFQYIKYAGAIAATPFEVVRQPCMRYMDRVDNKVALFAYEVLCCNHSCWLLPFVPIALFFGYLTGLSLVYVFLLSFFSIIPLAAIISHATEELADLVGDGWGSLLNASFGNVVELIVSGIALWNGQILIVQTSMIGSILSNSLLVLGFAIMAAGTHKDAGLEHIFRLTATGTYVNLMIVGSFSLCAAAVFSYVVSSGATEMSPGNDPTSIKNFSHWTAILLIVLYAGFQYFSLGSHKALFDGEGPKEKKEDKPRAVALICVLLTTCVVTAFLTDLLIKGIEPVVATGYVGKAFVGMILIPIVGNAAEHATAITMAAKSKLDLAIQISIGSSVQIGIFAIPLCVLFGWLIGVPMTLHFGILETVVLLLATLLVYTVLGDGRTNTFEGVMLLSFYTLVGFIYYFSPDSIRF